MDAKGQRMVAAFGRLPDANFVAEYKKHLRLVGGEVG